MLLLRDGDGWDAVVPYTPGTEPGDWQPTPPAFQRFTRNTGGAVYGWENTLANQGSRRPAQRTPIRGLYQCGSGTHPGGGVMGASGRLAALTILGEHA